MNNKHSAKLRDDLSALNNVHHANTFVEVQLNNAIEAKNIIVGSMYRPPNMAPVLFTDYLEQVLTVLEKETCGRF